MIATLCGTGITNRRWAALYPHSVATFVTKPTALMPCLNCPFIGLHTGNIKFCCMLWDNLEVVSGTEISRNQSQPD